MPPHADPRALLGHAVAGSYRIVQHLGTGGIGDVFLAELSSSREKRPGLERVALKVLRAEHRKRPELVRRFEREAVAASRVQHPNVLEVFGGPFDRDGLLYFTMELLVGLDLADTLTYTPGLSAARAVRIASATADGLCAVHAAGVVHRDVKPENIFLVHVADGREAVKLLDFGAAFLPGDDAAPSQRRPRGPTVVGTPEYMAPEQARGAPASLAVDVYSLGVVLYEMLTGTVPFPGHYPTLARLNPTGTPPSLRQRRPSLTISSALEAIVQRSLAKDPEARFASMSDLARELRATPEAKSTPSDPGGLGANGSRPIVPIGR